MSDDAADPNEADATKELVAQVFSDSADTYDQVIDFFARRPLKDSLKRTLRRFQQELEVRPEAIV